eukprot:8925367-Pyramimonas_sp.AAC.1
MFCHLLHHESQHCLHARAPDGVHVHLRALLGLTRRASSAPFFRLGPCARRGRDARQSAHNAARCREISRAEGADKCASATEPSTAKDRRGKTDTLAPQVDKLVFPPTNDPHNTDDEP